MTIGFSTMFLLCFTVYPSAAEVASTVGNMGLPLLACFWAISVGRKFRPYRPSPGVDAHPRARWWAAFMLMLGTLCYVLGCFGYYYYSLMDASPTPSVADIAYFATYPCIILGILLMATKGTSNIARGRLLLDTLLTVVGLATFSWYFLLGPMLAVESESLVMTVLSTGYAVFNLAVIFCVLFAWGRMENARAVVLPLVVASLLNVVSDTVWGYRILQDAYVVGEATDAGWIACFMFYGIAARAHLLAPYRGDWAQAAAADVVDTELRDTCLWRTLVPYAMLPLIVLLVIYVYQYQPDAFLRYGVYIGSLTLLCLLLVRQLLSIYENVGLYRQLAAAFGQLRESHQSLARTNAKIAATNQVSMDGVLVLDSTWTITEMNPAAERLLTSATSAIGRSLWSFLKLPTDEKLSNVNIAAATKLALVGHRLEVIAERPDGVTFPIELAIASVDLHGPPMFVAFVRDLTQQKAADAERDDLHAQLLAASRRAGMAEVATGVLHNVGNVLNSVNVAAALVKQTLHKSEVVSLQKAGSLITQHKDDLAAYMTADSRGRQLPTFLVEVSKCLLQERDMLLSEFQALEQGLEHIKQIVSAQQAQASGGNLRELVSPAGLVEAALKMHIDSFSSHAIEVVRKFQDVPPTLLDQHKVLQILINLFSNAKQSLKESNQPDRKLTIAVDTSGEGAAGCIRFSVTDNGLGIPSNLLTRVFAHGFTTRKDGHGFGLHSAANLAGEMGGSLGVTSDGPGQGATFTLELPAVFETQITNPLAA